MKIYLDKANYLDVRLDDDKKVSLSVKVDKNDTSYILVNTSLDDKKVEELISELVLLKSKM